MFVHIFFLLILCLQGTIYGASTANDQAKFCISTVNEIQKSLVGRTVNLDSLSLAFSPSNYQQSISFVVHYHFCTHHKFLNGSGSQVLCKDLEQWANDVNAGRTPAVDFREQYTYKFIWNQSPINLFIRPELLATLSLYTFRIHIPLTHIILDELCEDVINPSNPISEPQSTDSMDICRKPTSILLMLETLTSDVSV